MIANIITFSRILFSLAMLVLSPCSVSFAVFYLLCGVTDVLDGFLARKLHTESKTGERLDSIADLFFAAAYAVKILPQLCLPAWIRIWAVAIAALKISGIIRKSRKERRFCIEHSLGNKLTGLLLFLLPFTVHLIDAVYTAAAVCAAATVVSLRSVDTTGVKRNRPR